MDRGRCVVADFFYVGTGCTVFISVERQAAFEKEMEFYQEGAPKPSGEKNAKAGSAKGTSKPPTKLLEDMKTAEVDIQAQENLLAAKRKEVEGINAKYDEDKRRFAEVTKRK